MKSDGRAAKLVKRRQYLIELAKRMRDCADERDAKVVAVMQEFHELHGVAIDTTPSDLLREGALALAKIVADEQISGC